MNTDTGLIYKKIEIDAARACGQKDPARDFLDKLVPVTPTKVQLARKPPRVGRNEPCPCGSGKKFKKCCFTG